MSEMADAIRQLSDEKGVSEDSIKVTIETALKAAFKRRFGSSENCVIRFADDLSEVKVFARKVVVDGVYDPSQEIEFEEAKELNSEVEIGAELEIEIDPKKEFERSAVSQGKQIAHQGLNESFKDTLYNEYKDKIHEVIIGYYLRTGNNDSIYVDLGKVEGVLPKKYQSPREVYEKGDRIKTYITDIKKTPSGIQLILSRSDPEFVKKCFENEVPEIADGIVHIHKVVREAGYRAKVAVYSNKIDVDPVGACVGQKGQRIQAVIRELDEKIDVLKYEEDPHLFIANALLPAEVVRVVITNSETREAKAIVTESQFSIAIGKGGQNVRLANKLCDWNIDVITEEQAAQMDLTETDTRRAAEQLFSNNEETEESGDDVVPVTSIEDLEPRLAEIIKGTEFDDIVVFHDAVRDGSISKLEGLSREDAEAIDKLINENFEITEENSAEEAPAEEETDSAEDDGGLEEGEEFECPECHATVAYHIGMTTCPKCGVELAFE